jgi:hypothetical protein
MFILIDGVKTEVSLHSHNQFTGNMDVWGNDLKGRRCIVAKHTIKNTAMFVEHLKKGGAVLSSGHRYSMSEAQRRQA